MLINLHPKMQCLFEGHRYVGLKGGRGSSKSHSVVTALVTYSVSEKKLILCTREIQKSIRESAKKLIEDKIEEMGYAQYFRILETEIRCLPTGSRFIFEGLAHNIKKIKSLEGIDVTWNEEADATTEDSIDVLMPTALRKKDSQFIATWNSQKTKDPIHEELKKLRAAGEDCVINHINYYENPYLTDELRAQAEFCKKYEPEKYEHIWLGQPKPDDAAMNIIPSGWLRKCVEAHKLWKDDIEYSRVHAGLDVAESPEGDKNCLSVARGPELHDCISWKPDPTKGPAPRAHRHALEFGVDKLFYDAGGVGSPLKRDFVAFRGAGEDISYTVSPFLFGGKVQGKERPFIKNGKSTISNGDYFARVNAQAWWNLRQRAANTIKRLDGADIPIERCLLINPDIKELDELIEQLSGATFDEDKAGKIVINKRGEGDTSPDKADSVVMAFLHDIRRGLKA